MDLFDKLKTEPSIPKVSRDKKADVESPGCSSETSVTVSSKKTTKDKSCSLSPTKSENSFTAAANKQVRVVLERSKAITTAIHQQSSSPEQASKTLKNLTPTKAQIKQFDPAVLRKAQELQKIRIRKCYVRLKRFNMNNVKGSKKAGAKSLLKKASVKSSPTTKKSREASESLSPPSPANKSSPKRAQKSISKGGTDLSSPPAKKTKLTPKSSGQFHVKLTSPLRKSSFSARKEHNEWPKAKKTENKKNLSVTPTKFSRSKLIDQFGKRYFSAIVKVERCQHPTMVAFDSDAREQRSKRNKSKNLSVSFHSQVEIYDMSSKKRGGSKKMLKKKDQKSPDPVTLPLPARLQKIENGMVVNDIELDQSIFFNSSTVNLAASTPLTIKRSQNLPFKDDAATKGPFVQPADNDDEVEFIVPEINIPEKMLTSLTKPTPSPNRRSAEKSKEQNEKAEKSPKGQPTKSSSLQTKGTPKKTTPTKSSSVKNTPTKTNSSTPTRTAQNKTSQSQLQSQSTPTKSPAKPNDAVGKTTPLKVSKKLSENMKEAGEEKEKSTNAQHAEEPTTKTTEAIIEDLVESKEMKAAEVVVSSEFNINEDSTSKLVLRAESEEQEDTEQIKTSQDTKQFAKINSMSDLILASDNANTSGESFASALTETGNFVEKASNTTAEVGTHRTRVETETISESSNASTDVQLASSEASNTTMPKSIEISSKSSPKLRRQLSNSNSNLESVEDVSLKTVVMEELKFDETNEEPEIQSKLAATPTAPYTTNDTEKGKSILSESPDSVGISAKSVFHSSFAAKLAQIESTSNVASLMDLPINLLGEDTESSSDVHKKVDNLIADLMDDNEKQADTTDSVLNIH